MASVVNALSRLWGSPPPVIPPEQQKTVAGVVSVVSHWLSSPPPTPPIDEHEYELINMEGDTASVNVGEELSEFHTITTEEVQEAKVGVVFESVRRKTPSERVTELVFHQRTASILSGALVQCASSSMDAAGVLSLVRSVKASYGLPASFNIREFFVFAGSSVATNTTTGFALMQFINIAEFMYSAAVAARMPLMALKALSYTIVAATSKFFIGEDFGLSRQAASAIWAMHAQLPLLIPMGQALAIHISRNALLRPLTSLGNNSRIFRIVDKLFHEPIQAVRWFNRLDEAGVIRNGSRFRVGAEVLSYLTALSSHMAIADVLVGGGRIAFWMMIGGAAYPIAAAYQTGRGVVTVSFPYWRKPVQARLAQVWIQIGETFQPIQDMPAEVEPIDPAAYLAQDLLLEDKKA